MAMFLTKEQIIAATNLSAVGINDALKKGGYEDVVTDATFIGMSRGGSFIYECVYNEEGDEATARVFVYFEKDVITKEFALVADY